MTNTAVRVEDARIDIALRTLKRKTRPMLARLKRHGDLDHFVSRSERRRLRRKPRHAQVRLSPLSEAIIEEFRARQTRQELLERFKAVRIDRQILPHGSDLSLAQSHGVGMITKFLTVPRTFAVIKDFSKTDPGFPYGGKDAPEQDIVDPDIFATVRRELAEEIFFGLSVSIPEVTEDDIIDTIARPDRQQGGSHYKTFFEVVLPGDTPVIKGGEQEWVAKMTAEEVDALIAGDETHSCFLNDHAIMWRVYTQRKLHLI